ncbi:ABC-type glycerol-3-phosphate transport system substrate-binding protein [Paenibacillus sp. V4I9]|uniref:extracellular solute-binding protein n=1 Tax=Paenibacillus sp. V4I9 TaxID=3042308 RepID=UPI00278256F4|nr:extracellular solute-binding protein [Paenibacillus sp. V4I9]MDQ0887071.1 ABC-type glycerol-3-phosphate transport system substrate-binding protein [Paenibacillus sp. V4I9]
MTRKPIRIITVLSTIIMILAACSGKADVNKDIGAVGNATRSPVSSPTAAANPNGDTGGLKLPLVDKPTTLTWMLPSNSSNIKEDRLVVQEILKRTGIKVEFQTYSPQTYQDKLKVVVASGKLPDIFSGLKPAELKKIGKQKGVVAINDYTDHLPNFKKLYVEENNWVIKSYGDENGKLYTWPIFNLNRDVNHGFCLEKMFLTN